MATTEPYKRLRVHVIGDSADECIAHQDSVRQLLAAGSRDFPKWAVVAWGDGPVSEISSERPFVCLNIDVLGTTAADCTRRHGNTVDAIKLGSDDYERGVTVVWNAGGGGGP